MKKLFFIVVLLQGVTFSLYFGLWSIKDYIALEQAVAIGESARHEELRHRINVGFEGVWYLLSNMLIISAVNGLSSCKKNEKE